ncbi:MAG: FKBP-type peptidyl-prolyl cis-trans isomerase, partial [bacterium]|nr:FKBP-type peptidyl-prolyl cis-trans isomerase [bacterium]
NRGAEGFTFNLGAGQVIKGWDQGIVGMKEGGKRTLVIPASLAYGNQAVGGVIPANSDLVFQVELLKVQK